MDTIFISYSHDSEEHRQRVIELTKRLRGDGVRVVIDEDMLPGGPDKGWPHWCEKQVSHADRVLLVCTETYCRRYDCDEVEGTGLGVVCEGRIIRQILWDKAGKNKQFRPVLLDSANSNHIPLGLKGYHCFQLDNSEGYNQMLQWCSDSPTSDKPETTTIRWPEPPTDHDWQIANRNDILATNLSRYNL